MKKLMKMSGILAFAQMMHCGYEERNEAEKERIKDEWVKSQKYPRKKKKEIRKMLMIDWNFAHIDIFKF